MNSIDDMMVFAKVVETQSFTLAAEALGIGKARVSQIVTRLEQALNTRLLYRTTRALSLTDAGISYYDKCRMIQELAQQANAEIQTFNTDPSGIIRIATPISSAAVINMLSDFLHLYPQIKLDILESDSYVNLTETRCDIAIRASSALEDSSLYATQIGKFHQIICASPTYLTNFEPLQTAQDLLKLDWVSHEIVQGDKQLVFKSANGEIIKLNIQPKVQVRTMPSLKAFLLNHIGFGVLPSSEVRRELASGKLVQVLTDIHDSAVPCYAVYQEKALIPLRTRTLISFLRQQMDTVSELPSLQDAPQQQAKAVSIRNRAC